MSWDAPQTAWPQAKQSNPWDTLDQDTLLTMHLELQTKITSLKEEEMILRKYIVDRAFPDKHEGMNTQELGNGYQLKANVKFNYKLKENKIVEDTLDKIAKIGNQGAFIADRLVSWTPNFLLTEYRTLQESAEHSKEAQEILAAIGEMLIVDDAAPTLNIKEPKVKK